MLEKGRDPFGQSVIGVSRRSSDMVCSLWKLTQPPHLSTTLAVWVIFVLGSVRLKDLPQSGFLDVPELREPIIASERATTISELECISPQAPIP